MGRIIQELTRPGCARLDIGGGVGDYDGTYVLLTPFGLMLYFTVKRRQDNRVIVGTTSEVEGNNPAEFSIEELCPEFSDDDKDAAYEAVRKRFTGQREWAKIAGGIVSAFWIEHRRKPEFGLEFITDSEIPWGSALSSSAATACTGAVAYLDMLYPDYDFGGLTPLEIILACQKIEHKIVEALCGLMDQKIITDGNPNVLSLIRCRGEHPVEGEIELPDHLKLIAVYGGEKRLVSGDAYTRKRVASMMARHYLWHAGAIPKDGFVSDASLHDFIGAGIPELIPGQKFLDAHPDFKDPVIKTSDIEAGIGYSPRSAGWFALEENDAVLRMAELFKAANGDYAAAETLGKMLYKRHERYSGLAGLGSPRSDLLVRMLGGIPGVLGVSFTGGGAGGTAELLADRRVLEIGTVYGVVEEYIEETGLTDARVVDKEPCGGVMAMLDEARKHDK